MSSQVSFLLLLTLCLAITYQAYSIDNQLNKTSRTLNSFPNFPYNVLQRRVLNTIDSCWRSDPYWAFHRQALADCAIGFRSDALGGRNGPVYVVTDPSDDPVNPQPGTLRYGVIQTEPLWIIFERDMSLRLKQELMVNSYKTIDGRGANVNISNGPCITIDAVQHVIIHGISIHDCKRVKRGDVRSSPERVVTRQCSDGDGISILASSHIWIDHCYLARCTDGLIDVIHASTAVTISNNHFTQHDKVMLLGHQDGYTADRNLQVTVVFNYFGPQLVQRMPRVRYGFAHVANNRYEKWIMYAIGGSSNPTIMSEGNYFEAPDEPTSNKEVTKRETHEGPYIYGGWKWRSASTDVYMNGAFFVPSGYGSCAPNYLRYQAFAVSHGSVVPTLTADAGPLKCVVRNLC